MIPGNARLVTCPKCGSKKELLSLKSGNTFDAIYWSDTKREAPMLPQVSPIQKCPNCGTFYFTADQEFKQGDDVSFELGTLTFEDCKKAYEQFAKSQIPEKEANILRVQTILAYNDKYYRAGRGSNVAIHVNINKDDYDFFKMTVLEFIESEKNIDILVKAELMREIGNFEECIALLRDFNVPNLEDFKEQIVEHAEKGICGAFAFEKRNKDSRTHSHSKEQKSGFWSKLSQRLKKLIRRK